MARSDGDSWNITESVGATALGVASARASETASENPLITDPYATYFLDAAGDGPWNMYRFDIHHEHAEDLLKADPLLRERMLGMRSYMACRTKFFDEFFLDAAAAGVRQAVILAAGLDARTWRLDWPQGVVVYELDRPTVLSFKTETLAAHGAAPAAKHVGVPVDLREDWPVALRNNGFDPSEPTAWIAEGLLPYLPPEAQDLLFDRIDALSAAGSRVAVEGFGEGWLDPQVQERQRERSQAFREAAKLRDVDIPDVSELWYMQERADVAEFLTARGWTVTSEPAANLLERYGRPLPAGLEDGAPRSAFLNAQKSG